MNLIPLRDNYRKELINAFYEKAHILLNKIGCEEADELCYDNVFRVSSISGTVCKITRINNIIHVDVDYCEYNAEMIQPELLDTTTLERFVFNKAIAYMPKGAKQFLTIN